MIRATEQPHPFLVGIPSCGVVSGGRELFHPSAPRDCPSPGHKFMGLLPSPKAVIWGLLRGLRGGGGRHLTREGLLSRGVTEGGELHGSGSQLHSFLPV